VLPDGCIDLIWRAGRELVVAGPATVPVHAALPARTTSVGVRWRPGAGGSGLGLPLDALRDATVPIEALWGRDAAEALSERLADAETTAARLALLQDVVAARQGVGVSSVAALHGVAADPLVAAACRAVAADAAAGRITAVGPLADVLAVSERQLLRRFRVAVGYGPRTLARVLRFQRFLAVAWAPADAEQRHDRHDLARLAAELGFADQPHLTRECRRLAGTTPAQLLAGG
jgi:AraC-like DNA-binding protein